MKAYNDLMKFFKHLTEEQIVNILKAVIIIAVFFIFSSLLSYFIIKLFMWKEKDREKIKSNGFYLPLKALFIFIGIYIGFITIGLPSSVMALWKKIFKVALICIIAKGIVNFVDPKSEIAQKFRKKDMSKENHTAARFTGRILKYIIYIIGILLILTELGYDVSKLLTGLGIGGAIVALAAQDIVKSLLAGFSIMADKPFLVGDYIEVGGNEGTVLDISFRCTKIRTMDNTVITIPNSTVTATSTVNWSRMKQRRYLLNLKLPLETNSDQIETIVNRIRFILQTNEKVVPNSIEVHFDAISEKGANIMIYMYTKITAYEKYLNFKQEINEQILKVLESENMKLAYPGQNLYIMEAEPTSNINQKEQTGKTKTKRLVKE